MGRRVFTIILIIVFAVSILGGFSACKAEQAAEEQAAEEPEEITPEPKETLKIGVLMTFTTIISFIAEEARRGIEIAMDSIDYNINGTPIELLFSDITSQEEATSECLRMIQVEGCNIIMGSGVEHYDLAMISVCERNETINYMVLGVSEEATKPGQKYTFRGTMTMAAEGREQAEWLVETIFPLLGLESYDDLRVGVIFEHNDRGIVCSNSAIDTLKGYGITPVFVESFDPAKTTTMEPTVIKLMQNEVNVVIDSTDAVVGDLLWSAARSMDYNPLVAIGTGGFLGQTAAKDTLGNGVNGFCSTNWPVEKSSSKISPGMAEFAEAYREKYGEPMRTAHSASAYTCILALIDALERAEDIYNNDSVAKALRETDIPKYTIGNGWGFEYAPEDDPLNGSNTRSFNIGMQWQEGEMWMIWPEQYKEGLKLELPMKTWAEKEAEETE